MSGAAGSADAQPPPETAAGPVARFAAALESLGGATTVAPSRAAAIIEVGRIVGERSVVIDRDPDLDGVADGLDVVDDLWSAEVGITGAVAAVAETGTLALVFDADRPRSTSLVPPAHVALVPLGRLVETYAEAVELLARQRPIPSGMQFVTGPSSSGDIELTIVRGVHGPGELHVLFYPQ